MVQVAIPDAATGARRWAEVSIWHIETNDADALQAKALDIHSEAVKGRKDSKEGKTTEQPKKKTLVEVVRRYFAEKIEGKKHTAHEWKRIVDRYIAVCPHADVPFHEMPREQYHELLSEVRSPQNNGKPWEEWPIAPIDRHRRRHCS